MRRRRRAVRRSIIGLPVVAVVVGAVAWLLGLTPLPPAPAAATELVALGRRATIMARGMPMHAWHLPTTLGWVRARMSGLRALRLRRR